MKSCFTLILIYLSTLMFGQLGCNSFEYLKTRTVHSQSTSKESWFKFRAKGATLDFVGAFEKEDSLFGMRQQT